MNRYELIPNQSILAFVGLQSWQEVRVAVLRARRYAPMNGIGRDHTPDMTNPPEDRFCLGL